jgi:NTE family protein
MLGLALSGGGFRATLFHVGSLLRINESGLLARIDEVTSVSGGSIIAAHLGVNWSQLRFNDNGVAANFEAIVVNPIREFCGRTIDVGTILGGILNPIRHPSELLIGKYRKRLFGDRTLRDLPAKGEGPRFTIYATSLQTGASVRFTRDYVGEYHLGKIVESGISIARAVAASSAFPPPLCPVKLKLDPSGWKPSRISDLHGDPELSRTMWLADGGVYDNLGLERLTQVCDRILVSDAGAPFHLDRNIRSERFSQLARTKRALDIISDQVRSLRARDLIRRFANNEMKGAYWAIGSRIGDFPIAGLGLSPALVADSVITKEISGMRTRLNRFNPTEQARLINWGYALADAGLRSRYDATIADVPGLPYPEFPI